MKKVFVFIVMLGCILSASHAFAAQQQIPNKAASDTTSIKSKIPKKEIHIQKPQRKKTEKQDLDPAMRIIDQPLLINEKDSLHQKAK
jgi:hypothetical protein